MEMRCLWPLKLSPINSRIRMQAGGQAHPGEDGSTSLGNRCALCFSHHHRDNTPWPAALPTGTAHTHYYPHPPTPLFRKDWLGLRREEVWTLYYLQCVKSWNSYQKELLYQLWNVQEQIKSERKTAPWEEATSVLFTALAPCPEQHLAHRRLSSSIYQMKQGKHKPRIVTRLLTGPRPTTNRFQADHQRSSG